MDAGNLSTTPDKLDIITTIMADLKYDAIGMGVRDISIRDEFLRYTSQHKLVVVDPSPNAAESTVPYLIKEIDGVKVGVVSFPGETFQSVSGSADLQRLRALYGAYKAARDASDILILLDQANKADSKWIERNGPRLGFPDVVVGGLARTTLAKEQIVGRTHIVPTAAQAKKMGVVDVTITPGEDPAIDCQTIALDGNIPEDEAVVKRIQEFKVGDRNAETTAATMRSPHPHMSSFGAVQPYYAPRLCKSCHPAEYEDWEKSKHAAAIQTLVKADRVEPECLQCHSEMFRTIRTAQVPKDSAGGVECATCHKAAIPHGSDRREVAARTTVDIGLCRECHTNEKSPKYDDATYLARITHKVSPTADAPKPPPPKQSASHAAP